MASTSGLTYRHSRSCPGANGTTCCAGSWRAVVCIPGSRDQLRETFHSYSEARRWKAATQADVDKGKIATTPSQQPKLRQAAETFLAGAQAGVILNSSEERYKPATLRSYERALRLRLLPALGDKKLGKITRADVQRLVRQWRAQGLQDSTVRNSLDPLRVILRGAMEDGLIAV